MLGMYCGNDYFTGDFQRFLAALRAMDLRLAGDSFAARALPPFSENDALTDVIGRRKLKEYGFALGHQELRGPVQFLHHPGCEASLDSELRGIPSGSLNPFLFRTGRVRRAS